MADTLVLWAADTATELTTIPWSTVYPGSTEDTRFRVVNTSELYTAAEVTVGLAGSDTYTADLFLSLDGLSFAKSLELGDMPPGATSLSAYLRRITPSAQLTGLRWAAVRLATTGWSYLI